jgi:hypothetical protein
MLSLTAIPPDRVGGPGRARYPKLIRTVTAGVMDAVCARSPPEHAARPPARPPTRLGPLGQSAAAAATVADLALGVGGIDWGRQPSARLARWLCPRARFCCGGRCG